MDNRITRRFTEHPATVGESYFEHMAAALSFSASLLRAASACFIHAFAPWLCTKTGSKAIAELNQRMVTHRDRRKTFEDNQTSAASS